MKCALCEATGWVCENHSDTPWEGEHACKCGGAGMPCPKCNPSDLDHPHYVVYPMSDIVTPAASGAGANKPRTFLGCFFRVQDRMETADQ